jgi:hypothetical protein
LAAIAPVATAESNASLAAPFQPVQLKSAVIERAAVLTSWSTVVSPAKHDVKPDVETIDIVLLDTSTNGYVGRGNDQKTSGSVWQVPSSYLPSPEIVVPHRSDDSPTPLVHPLFGSGDLQDGRPPDLPEPMQRPGSLEGFEPEPPTTLSESDHAPLSRDPIGLNAGEKGEELMRPDAPSDAESELLSPSLFGLTIRRSLAAPADPGTVHDRPPTSHLPQGIDVAWTSRQIPVDAGPVAPPSMTNAGMPPHEKQLRQLGAIEQYDLPQLDRQQRTQSHLQRVRPAVQWQDTGSLRTVTTDPTNERNSKASEGERSLASSRGGWKTVTLRFDPSQEGSVEDADKDAAQVGPGIDDGPVLWVEKCLKTLSRWLRQASPSSLAGTAGRFVPALLATASVIGLLDSESQLTTGRRKSGPDSHRRSGSDRKSHQWG